MSITSPSADLAARARAWVAEDPEPRGREELERLLAEGPTDELAGRFSGELRFALPDCGARSGEPGGGAADGGAVHPRWSRTAARLRATRRLDALAGELRGTILA